VGKQECLYTHVVIDGIEYPRIPLGDDREVAAGFSDPKYYEDGIGCECTTPIGGMHHVMCDHEMCPRCGKQSLGCLMGGDGCEVASLCRVELTDEAKRELERYDETITLLVAARGLLFGDDEAIEHRRDEIDTQLDETKERARSLTDFFSIREYEGVTA
jgi:hypothetical protein